MDDFTNTTVRFKLYFEDDTTANLDFSGVDTTNLQSRISTIKSTVRNFNADPSAMSNLMVSKSGAPWVGISAVTITTTERMYIF